MGIKKGYSFIIAVLLLLISGCASSPSLRVSSGGAPLKIAAILPLTGSNRIPAEQMAEGIKMAEFELNSHSSSGLQVIELHIFDSKGTAAGAAEAVNQAASTGCAGIIAGYSTDEVSAVIPFAAAAALPVVIPLATGNFNELPTRFVYRNSYTDQQQSEMLAGFLHYWRQVRHFGILADTKENAFYQRSVARDIAQSIRDIGGEVSAMIMTPDDPTDAELKDMLKTDPEAIIICCGGKRAAVTLKRLRNFGFTGIICGPDSWDSAELIAELENFKVGDALYTAFFSDSSDVPEYRRFHAAFRKKFFHIPGACETQSYDSCKLLFYAFKNASTLEDFDRNWQKIKRFQGAAAVYTMLKNGGIDRTIYINTIGVRRNGDRLVPYARFSKKLQYSKLKEYKKDFFR